MPIVAHYPDHRCQGMCKHLSFNAPTLWCPNSLVCQLPLYLDMERVVLIASCVLGPGQQAGIRGGLDRRHHVELVVTLGFSKVLIPVTRTSRTLIYILEDNIMSATLIPLPPSAARS